MKIPDFQQQLRLAAIANIMNSPKNLHTYKSVTPGHIIFAPSLLLHFGPCVILAKSKFSLHTPKAQNLNLKVDLQILTRLWSLVLAYTNSNPAMPDGSCQCSSSSSYRVCVWCRLVSSTAHCVSNDTTCEHMLGHWCWWKKSYHLGCKGPVNSCQAGFLILPK